MIENFTIIKIKAIVKREDIVYVDGLIESYDDIAVMRTVDPKLGIVEFLVSPCFEKPMNNLIKNLKDEIGLIIHN